MVYIGCLFMLFSKTKKKKKRIFHSLCGLANAASLGVHSKHLAHSRFQWKQAANNSNKWSQKRFFVDSLIKENKNEPLLLDLLDLDGPSDRLIQSDWHFRVFSKKKKNGLESHKNQWRRRLILKIPIWHCCVRVCVVLFIFYCRLIFCLV